MWKTETSDVLASYDKRILIDGGPALFMIRYGKR
ncbi:MAG: hypothetical protein RJA57_1392 [Bacteroidota bacterium]